MDNFFSGEFLFSQSPQHTGQEKPWEQGSGGAYDPLPVNRSLKNLTKKELNSYGKQQLKTPIMEL